MFFQVLTMYFHVLTQHFQVLPGSSKYLPSTSMYFHVLTKHFQVLDDKLPVWSCIFQVLAPQELLERIDKKVMKLLRVVLTLTIYPHHRHSVIIIITMMIFIFHNYEQLNCSHRFVSVIVLKFASKSQFHHCNALGTRVFMRRIIYKRIK